MLDVAKILDRFRIDPGEKFRIKDHDPGWAGDEDVPKDERKRAAQELLSQDVSELAEAQELLYASDTWAILLIFQGMDAAGKDSTIKHVMRGVNPQGCEVHSFKHPTYAELDHTFLWRCTRVLPARGRIGIFNRSYYEELLIVKVHPELVAAQRIPSAKVNKDFWQARYEDINALERHLTRNGTAILKFFLNISPEEQRERFLERLKDPRKLWKFNPGDVDERKCWDDYMKAYEAMINETSTEWAPWHVIPADRKWVTRALVARILTRTIRSLDLEYPKVGKEELAQIEAARKKLERE